MSSEQEPSRVATGWRPLLEGQSADQARVVVGEIARVLVEDWPPARLGPSLAGGSAGVALLFAYLDRAEPGEGHRATAHRYLDQAVAAVRSERLSAALFSGFPGVAWSVEHLDEGGRDRNSGIDAALIRRLRQGTWRRSFDLVNGLVGLGIYALERLPRPGGQEIVAAVVERLDEIAERDGNRACWPSFALDRPITRQSRFPAVYYDIGMAHGEAGVVAFLGAARRAGFRSASFARLLEESTSWLLDQWRHDDQVAFSPWTTPGSATRAARSAWCYGDPGVAAALLLAERPEGTRLARLAAGRPVGHAGVIDAGLCHGAAGLGLVFARLAQMTGLSAVRDAAVHWWEATLEMAQPGRGIAGYAVWSKVGAGIEESTDDAGWLTGVSGIGLALLAATTNIEPEWDRALLLSARWSGSGQRPV